MLESCNRPPIRTLIASCIAGALFGAPMACAETITLGSEPAYPPLVMVDSGGNLTGFQPDLAREMCKRMNVECKFTIMEFKALVPSLMQGKFDAIVTQLAPTPERQKNLGLTVPIIFNPATYVVRKNTNYTFTKEGMAGKGLKTGQKRGGFQLEYLQNRYGDAIQYVYYDDTDQIRLDLIAGRIDMTFDSKINWRLDLIDKPEGKDFKLDGGEVWGGDPSIPEDQRGYVWAVRKDNEALRDRINKTLTSMLEDCTYTKIRRVYIKFPIIKQDEACEGKS